MEILNNSLNYIADINDRTPRLSYWIPMYGDFQIVLLHDVISGDTPLTSVEGNSTNSRPSALLLGSADLCQSMRRERLLGSVRPGLKGTSSVVIQTFEL